MPVFDPIPAAPEEAELPLSLWGPEYWAVLPWEREPTDLGYNSHTWKVTDGTHTRVLKAVPADHADRFEVGLAMAAVVAAQGIPSGAPRPLPDGGGLVARSGEWAWALLDLVTGEKVDQAEPEQLALVGAVLGRVHRALADQPVPRGGMVWGQMDWLLAEGEFLEPYPWIQPALREAMSGIPDSLTTGVVHGDPRIAEFRVDGAVAGLIDWGEVMYAPHIFDVGTLLDYLDDGVDQTPLLRGYLSESLLGQDEFAHVGTMRKFRSAAEAWIYARRAWFDITLGQRGEFTNASILDMKKADIEAIDAGEREVRLG